MCIYIKKEDIEGKIAEEDVIVFKQGNICNYNEFHSFHQDFIYYRNKLNFLFLEYIKREFVRGLSIFRGYEGFHSRKEPIKRGYENSSPLGVFIIPKGSTYWEGKENDTDIDNYLSTHIVYMGTYCEETLQEAKNFDITKCVNYETN